jgi:hypothetical protein
MQIILSMTAHYNNEFIMKNFNILEYCASDIKPRAYVLGRYTEVNILEIYEVCQKI